jgi:hypothetical protein
VLIHHHRVIEKIRTDIPAGELTLHVETFNDQPIARGVGRYGSRRDQDDVALAMQ